AEPALAVNQYSEAFVRTNSSPSSSVAGVSAGWFQAWILPSIQANWANGLSAAMTQMSTGARAAALAVTNEHTSQACQLQGISEFRILQAGEDLNVTVSEYGLSSETQDVYENITVGPGESAEATLHWRGARSAYHDDSAQQAEIRIADTWIEAEFEFHQSAIPRSSPFDLINHSELKISEWVPSS